MDDASPPDVMRMRDVGFDAASSLLARYGLVLHRVEDATPIPGSYWGECEAGIIAHDVYARDDTPVHSLLHEAGHLIVLPADRRTSVHTDATDSIDEENAVCVLQSLMANEIPGFGRDRLFADMDAWGYTFRLGSARAYVEQDAEEAWRWLLASRLIDEQRRLLLP
ncbi:hypothetical protein [Solilutibacter tolerans]|uniref:Uncharacterized protein n=1 Tax=Solilutibacter tolerans TaxID=1604334 RepID=A0A1N6PHP2_9GAMM|nr:hypothetical protein [Lysobacter tolerans]SIQ03719.1 hypothetical protein SAMN05421546_0616 [Lysobacter tolerans]